MMLEIERDLAAYHGREYAKLVGNGTTAIYIALKSNGLKYKNIAIPDSVCINVPLSILISNNYIYYIDNNFKDLGVNNNEIESKIEKIDAILGVHNFGHNSNIEELAQICKRHNKFLIEDACLNQGAISNNKKIGSFGDVSILSFGDGKNVNIGHGGALLTDNKYLYNNICELINHIPHSNEKSVKIIDKINSDYTSHYNKYYIDNRISLLENRKFYEYLFTNKEYYISKFNEKKLTLLVNSFKEIEKFANEKQENWWRFHNKLYSTSSNKIEILKPFEGSVPWRFNLLVNNRDKIMKDIHEFGLKASSWHPPTSLLFSVNNQANNFVRPNSNIIGNKILNLWIDKYYSELYSDKVIEIINKNL